MNDIAPQRQRQTLVFAPPPHPQVLAHLQAFLLIGELALVDDEPDIGPPRAHRGKDLVERHDKVIELLRRLAQPQLQREEGAGHRARHGDLLAGDFRPGELLLRHQHRPIAVAHARAARQQGILVAHVGVGVNADRRDVQFAPRGPLVEGLDVLQDVLEAKPVGRNQLAGQPVEHERIVRVGRVAER